MNESKIKKSIENVRLFHSNQMFLKYNLQTIDISKGIDWNYRHETSHSTYQVYLHSLPILNDFVIVGTKNKKSKELLNGKELIYNWISHGKKTEFAWHEHAVSSRILNIIKFQENAGEYKLDDNIFQEIVEEHCTFLNDEENYKQNNHGLMMDNALITASNYIEKDQLKKAYIDKSLYRIRTSVYRDLTRQGLHIENSPEYHNLYIVILNQIFETITKYEIKLEKDIYNLRESALKVRADLLKPNFEFPLIGDTGQTMYKSINKTFNDFIDFEGGLVILQNKNERKEEYSRYFTFSCGYISKTHKHHDDLSLTYYNNGHDVIVDAGKYSYAKDKDREFITSPESHSTVYPEGETYPLLQFGQLNHEKLKITKYFSTNDVNLVEGINNLYDGLELRRTCIVTKQDDLIVLDRVINSKDATIVHSFNINENAEIIKGDSGFEINIDKEKYLLEIIDSKDIYKLEVKEGFISKKFNEKISNKIAKIKHTSSNSEVIIILKNQKSNTEIISRSAGTLIITIDNKEFI